MHRYVARTAGERLLHLIHAGLENDKSWRYLQEAIRMVGDSACFCASYRHHAALCLCCNLIGAGRSATALTPGNLDLLRTVVEGFPWNHLNSGNRLLRLLSEAVVK